MCVYYKGCIIIKAVHSVIFWHFLLIMVYIGERLCKLTSNVSLPLMWMYRYDSLRLLHVYTTCACVFMPGVSPFLIEISVIQCFKGQYLAQ